MVFGWEKNFENIEWKKWLLIFIDIKDMWGVNMQEIHDNLESVHSWEMVEEEKQTREKDSKDSPFR